MITAEPNSSSSKVEHVQVSHANKSSLCEESKYSKVLTVKIGQSRHN